MTERSSANTTQRWRPLAFLFLALTGVGLFAILFIELWQRRARQQARKSESSPLIAPLTVEGLTEAEAAARLEQGQDNSVQWRARRTRQTVIKESIFTIFNLNLVGLAFVQGLMGRWLDVLITIGVMLANVGANLFQEEFAKFRLRSIQEEAQVQATIVRESKIRSIDPGEIVLGDVIAVGSGDEIMVDGVIVGEGELFVDESLFSGNSTRLQKKPGDRVKAGSICVGGHAVLEAEKVGNQRQIATKLEDEDDTKVELTPIEQILNHVMRTVLVIVIILAALLLVRYYRFDALALEDAYLDAINVVFNVAPAGLFFMVVLTYVAATADLGQLGALVYQSRSVESLAQLQVLCIGKAGILTGGRFEYHPLGDDEPPPPLAESRIRQILGDFAHSATSQNLSLRALAATFEGSKRHVHEEAAHFSVYGWSALVFDEDDLRGVYVIGDASVLQALQAQQEEQEKSEDSLIQNLSGRASSIARPFGHLFKRNNSDSADDEDNTEQPSTEIEITEERPGAEESTEDESGSVFGRFKRRIGQIVRPSEEEPATPENTDETLVEETTWTFAYAPEVASIQYDGRDPVLPSNLIPLCHLSYQEKVRPESIAAVRDFADRGVEIKVFTADTPEKTVNMLKQAEFRREGDAQIQTITGPDLNELSPEDFTQAVKDNTVFGRMLPRQMEQVTSALQDAGLAVGLLGDGVGDLPSMRHAEVAISQLSGSPAVFVQADIVLMEDSPAVLSRVVDKGQRIVNGLLDVLKLYLNQIAYLLLLIVIVPLFAGGFPYTSAQGGMVALVTLTIPAIGLSIWAGPGIPPIANLRRLLAHFVLPSAITMAAAAYIVYVIFLDRYGTVDYAQIALSHALVATGLLLVLFIRPPLVFTWGRIPKAHLGDLRPTFVVLFSVIVWWAITHIPLAVELLKVEPLESSQDYMLIGLAALAWAFGAHFLWLAIPLQSRVRARVFGNGNE